MIVIVANPVSGQTKKKSVQNKLSQICGRLKPHGEADLVWTERAGDAEQIARKAAASGVDLVIAAGGDGTIHEVANGLAGTKTALSLLPLGTENVMAKHLGLPLEPEACCRELLTRKKRQVDLGQVDFGKAGKRHFLLFAGIGFDAHVVKKTSKSLKNALGGLAYALTATREMWMEREKAPSFHLEADGVRQELSAWLLFAGNIPIYGWKLPILPMAKMEDGFLDACYFPSGNLFKKVEQVVSVFRGNHLNKNGGAIRFKTLQVVTDSPLPIQADGEYVGETPCVIQVVPKALWVQF